MSGPAIRAVTVKRPAVERTESRYLTPDEVRTLVGGLVDHRLRALFRMLLGTGLRRGEALAARWDDLDLDGGHLRVRGTHGRVGGRLTITEPKTEKSRRVVPLRQALVIELRAHRVRQVAERLHAGSAWTEQGLIFCTQTGMPLDPRNALRSLTVTAARVELTDISLHTLRHSAASALISSGVHMKVVQELLGHSSYAITADVYSHVGVSQQEDAADKLAEAFGW
jgi:integrase